MVIFSLTLPAKGQVAKMEFIDFDPRFGLAGFFLAVLIVFIKVVYGFAKDWKTRIIAKWDDHYSKTEDHEVKLAVHEEKHRSHEKRLDNLESDGTRSRKK